MALLYGNETIPCDANVIDWRAHGMGFTPEMPNLGKRPKKGPHQIVVHWTGGEAPPPRMYRSLRKRNLGVEFGIDFWGHVYQFADPARVFTAHAAGVNVGSIGIEVQCAGVFPHPAWSRGTQNRMLKKWPRGAYRDTINKFAQTHLMFNADQLTALCELVGAFIAEDIIRADMPVHGKQIDLCDHFPVRTTALPEKQRASFRGIVGHYHVAEPGRRRDPGTQPLVELADELGLS